MSPDGAVRAITIERDRRVALDLFDLRSGTFTRLAELSGADTIAVTPIRWGTDGFIYYARSVGSERPELWRVRAAGGAPVRYSTLPLNCGLGSISLADDARTGACIVADLRPDIWLIQPQR